MGMVVVACRAAMIAGSPATTMTLTPSRTNSAASSGKRSVLPSADRYSMTTFRPSTQPCCSSPWRNASPNRLVQRRRRALQDPDDRDLPRLLRLGGERCAEEAETKRL